MKAEYFEFILINLDEILFMMCGQSHYSFKERCFFLVNEHFFEDWTKKKLIKFSKDQKRFINTILEDKEMNIKERITKYETIVNDPIHYEYEERRQANLYKRKTIMQHIAIKKSFFPHDEICNDSNDNDNPMQWYFSQIK